MIGHRSFLLYTTFTTTITTYLTGAVPLMTETKFIFITNETEDPHFNQPYIDVEEWRDAPTDVPNVLGDTTQRQGTPPIKARHLYVHGDFKGTDAKFAFYCPPKEQ